MKLKIGQRWKFASDYYGDSIVEVVDSIDLGSASANFKAVQLLNSFCKLNIGQIKKLYVGGYDMIFLDGQEAPSDTRF
jgi:hypothetical protein